MKHQFAYTSLVHCGYWGCLLVGELKKGRGVYHHCTGKRGKCPKPYTREEILSNVFANILQELVILPPSYILLRQRIGRERSVFNSSRVLPFPDERRHE